MADELGIALSRASYHVRVLDTHGCLTRKEGTPHGGAIENRYESAVTSSAPVMVILKTTAKDDAKLLRQERTDPEKAGI